jgi:hypothetical protein
MNIYQLNKDLLCYIFSMIREFEGRNISLTCKLFNECIKSNRFQGWKKYSENDIERDLIAIHEEIKEKTE